MAGFLDFSTEWVLKFLPLFSSWPITVLIGICALFFLLKKKLFLKFLTAAAVLLGILYFLQPAPVVQKRPFRIAGEFQKIHEELIPYFEQVGKNFPAEPPAVAMYPFTVSGGGDPPFRKYLTESMTITLSKNRRMKLGLGLSKTDMGIPEEEIDVLEGLPPFDVDPELIRREVQISESDAKKAQVVGGGRKAAYVLFGKITPIGSRVRVNIQIVNTDTAQILEAFNHDFNKTDVEEFL
jgi:hypothetical protein